jgi:hypothetical protein
MLTHACVAIQLLGAPATPDGAQALQQRCDGILGAGQCRVVDARGNPATSASVPGAAACWQATVTRASNDTAASVVVRAAGAPDERGERRDLTFQARDELNERWATLGLVIAALVTLEEHSADASPASEAVAAAGPPGTTPPIGPSRPWFSRDPAVPARLTVSVQPEPPRTLPRVADLRVLAMGDVGRLPWTTLGARLAATFQVVRYLDLEVGGAYLTSIGTAAIPVAGGGTGGGHFNLWSATLGLCPHSELAMRLTGHVCAGGDLSATTASGFGVAETAQTTAWVGHAWFGFDSELHLSRHLALIAEYKTEAALRRPVFVIDGAGNVYQPSRVSVNLSLGLAAVF